MSKYAVMIVLDLDVGVPVSPSEAAHDLFEVVERVTKKRVQAALGTDTDGIEVRMIRAKYLGMVENEQVDK